MPQIVPSLTNLLPFSKPTLVPSTPRSTPLKTIADTMKQVADLLDLAKQQRERQSKLKVERNAWHTVGKGVRTLPIELLGKIFEVVTTSDSKGGTSESDWEAGMSHLVNLVPASRTVFTGTGDHWEPNLLTSPRRLDAPAHRSYQSSSHLASELQHYKALDPLPPQGQCLRQGLEHLSSASPSLNTEQSQRFANIITQIQELSLSDWTWCNIMTPQYAQAWDNGTLKSLYISNESPAFDDIFTFDGSYLPKSIRLLQLHGTHSLPMNVLSELPMLECSLSRRWERSTSSGESPSLSHISGISL
ncbi:hypothetical protein BKA70DRAFT_1435038 [Coprinopsis sp. MPI-PUGE-AT-0042]|nr:hypothetical protein BKA70DRAFT_1435038 [Coprinopsis sp. MPI-PUGE-AT-0042]